MITRVVFLLAGLVQVCLCQTVTFTPYERMINLQWMVDDITATYEVKYSLSGDLNNQQTISVTLPAQNGSEVNQPISGLSPGYLYEVELLRNALIVEKRTIATRPLPVQSLKSDHITTTSMNISWTTAAGSQQDTFKVLVGGVSNTSFTFTSENVSTLWYSLTGLQRSQVYDVSVLAYSHGGPSNTSLSIEANTAPLPPTEIAVVALDTETLNISWVPDSNSVQDSFRIGYHYNSSAGNEVIVNITCSPSNQSFCIVTMSNGLPGQLYEVTVYSLYREVPSTGVTTFHTTIPSPVTDIEEIPLLSGTDLGFKWKNPINSFFSKFVIIIKEKLGELKYSLNSDIENLTLAGLQPGSMFNVSIYVITDYENSTAMKKVFYTKPLPVQTLEFTAGTDSAMATWTLDTSGMVDVIMVDIVLSPINSSLVILSADTNNLTFTDLLPGNSYNVTVTTKLSFKESDPLSKILTTLPLKPETVTVEVVSGSEVKITWKAPRGHVDAYELTLVEISTNDIQATTVTATTYTYMSLKAGAQYNLKLESRSAAGRSDPVSQTFVTNPTAVPSLSLTTVDSSTLLAAWTAPTNDFDHYELNIDPPHVTSPINITRSSGTQQYTFQPLQSGVLYTVTIRTFSQSMSSSNISDRAVTNPMAVESLTVGPYGTGLNVTWKTNIASQQSGFIVSYKDLPAGVVRQLEEVPAIENHFDYSALISDLVAGGTYEVRVQAWQNISGENAASIRQTVNGSTKPNAVEALTGVATGSDIIELDWSLQADSKWDHFFIRHRPSLRDPNSVWEENSTFSTNLTLTRLFPGERYEVEVYAVNNEIRSDVKQISVVTVPLGPDSITVLEDKTTDSSVTLQWTYNLDATFAENWIVSYTDDTGNRINKTVSKPASGSLIEASVDSLQAGYKYTFSVQSEVLGIVSGEVTVEAFTVPANNIGLLFTERPTNASFAISYIVPTEDSFDQIIFKLLNTSMEVARSKTNPLRSVEFSDLDSGAFYRVEVQTISGSVESGKKVISAQTLPNAPTVSATSTAEEIILTISRPSGGIENYTVTCYSSRNLIVKDTTLTPAEGVSTVTVDQLLPYVEYRCEVSSVFGNFSSKTTVTISTNQAAPSEVRNLLAIESAPREVTLTWDLPAIENGAIRSYVFDYIGRKDSEQIEGTQREIQFPANSTRFDSLKAGFTYTFFVRARTIADSEPASVEIKLKTYKPQYKEGIDDAQATPKSALVNQQQVAINFTNAFSENYGEIIQYTVIVTEDKNSTDIRQKHFLPGWKTARQNPTIKAYQVMSNCSTFFDAGSTCDTTFKVRKRSVGSESYKVFTIGSETNCDNQYYCNGPLKPDTVYYVTLRAYTTMQYQDTPFSGAIRTAQIPETDTGPNAGVIVAIVISLLIVIVLVVLVVLFLRRRMAMKSNMYQHQQEAQVQYRSSLSKRKSSCPVNVIEFREHVLRMKADSDFRYAEQFEDLKEVGRGQACSFAELPCNRGKNRFTNILPYDHSRVKLSPIDDEEGSDYINANYIPVSNLPFPDQTAPVGAGLSGSTLFAKALKCLTIRGFSSKREYIVCQGPLPGTRDEYWRMLWEQNCRNIVMLTKCMEKGREKCDKYWPSGADALFYGDLQVVALNETVFPDWTMTEFKISLGDQSRQIRHFHFTSWPDFGVPKKEQVLVRFVKMVREKLIKDGGPITVHCSAGVGRSGTFIVLDRLLQEIKTQHSVDIYSIVAELRRDRVWMVQTEQQYIYVHNCILCVLEGREDEHVYANVGHSNVAFEDDEGVDLS